MQGENTSEHSHNDHDPPNSEDANSDDSRMTEEELMKSIEATIKQRERQRAFWDEELREMNHWLRL